MKIISLLLENGADPYARDNEGVSVSELVYDNKYTWPGKEKGGSMLEDIWDRALHDSGHDIALFRQNYPRQVNYTSYYTAKEFRDLWYDREDGVCFQYSSVLRQECHLGHSVSVSFTSGIFP